MNAKHMLYCTITCLVITMLIAVPLAAQEPVTELRLVGIDTSQFPQVRVRVVPLLASGLVAESASSDAFRVYEDGVPRQVLGVTTVQALAQIAIVFYAAPTSLERGATGRAQKDEAIEAIDALVLNEDWTGPGRQILLIMSKNDRFEVRQNWTPDGGLIHNSADSFDFGRQTVSPPLYPMLLEAIARMKDVPDYDQRAKFLLILSDRRNIRSVEQARDVINQARASGVTILSVELGTRDSGQPEDIRRMARETGGISVEYTGRESVSRLYGIIASQRNHYEIAYSSAINQTGIHGIQAGVMAGGAEVRSANAQVPLTVLPPHVTINYPPSGVVYERRTDKQGEDPANIEPRQDQVQFTIEWPDGHPRSIVQIMYFVDGVAYGPFSPDKPLIWDFSHLPKGKHSLYLVAKDEIGLEGRSEPLSAEIIIEMPEMPSLPGQFKWVTLAALAAGILALALALYVVIRRPKAVQDFGKAVVDKINETVPGLRRRRNPAATKSSAARVYLVEQKPDGSPGQRYPISSFPAMLGRDPARSDVVLSHPTISRLHASIREEMDGVFVLQDEGGQYGTFVNDQEVPIGGKLKLKHGDKIDLGDATFTFEISDAKQPEDTQPTLFRRETPPQ